MGFLKRSPALPFEVIERALGYVYDSDAHKQKENQRTLHNCMLTCRTLVPRSRYLLFLSLYICSPLFQSLRLLTLLTSLRLSECEFTSSHEMHRMLSALPALTTLELHNVTWKTKLSLDAGSPYRPLHLDSLSVNEELDQILTWFVRTTACHSLRALHVILDKRDRKDYRMLKPVLQRLGPSLESLVLTFWGYHHAFPDHNDVFGLETNTHLKSFTIECIDFCKGALDFIVHTIVHISSTQLSRLTFRIRNSADKQAFDCSGWDAFLAILVHPVFESVECIEIVLRVDGCILSDNTDVAKYRRCLRRLCQMLPEWLAPITARGVLQVRIEEDRYEEEDGPYVEGDDLVLKESEPDKLDSGAPNCQIEEETTQTASLRPLPLAPSTSRLPRVPQWLASFPCFQLH